jgi:hypothetical protein
METLSLFILKIVWVIIFFLLGGLLAKGKKGNTIKDIKKKDRTILIALFLVLIVATILGQIFRIWWVMIFPNVVGLILALFTLKILFLNKKEN